MSLCNRNIAISPLPFYSAKQTRDDFTFTPDMFNHFKDYAFGNKAPIIAYRNAIPSFQFFREDDSPIFYISLYSYNPLKNEFRQVADIRNSLAENGLDYATYDGIKSVRYPGIKPVPELNYEGLYFITFDAYSYRYYSDLFSVVSNVDDCLRIDYGNSHNLSFRNAVIRFSDDFRFRVYLKTQLGKPEYGFEEKATERMGYNFIESQVSKKTYNFSFLAPEYLCDALRILPMCDDIVITSRGITYDDIINFTIDFDWQEQGDLAKISCSFDTDVVSINIGGHTEAAPGVDFNNDYNEDYDISSATDAGFNSDFA